MQRRTGPGLLDLLNVVGQKCARGEKIWLQDVVLSQRYDRLPLTHENTVAIVDFMKSPERSQNLWQVLTNSGITSGAASALQPAFSEYEQTQLARWRGLALFAQPKYQCPMELFGARNATALKSGSKRGFFTDKTIQDVRSSLSAYQDSRPINIVGEIEVLETNNIPVIERFGDWGLSVVAAATNKPR